jgi:hypothetical protein
MGLLQLPYELKPFQLDTAALAALSKALVVGVTTGGGKSTIALTSAAVLFEDNEIDLAIIECEVSKLGEWQEDLALMTKLSVLVYDGPPSKRAKLRRVFGTDRLDLGQPQVLLGVYETFRGDLAEKVPPKEPSASTGRPGASRSKPKVAHVTPGPLLEVLRGKRVLFIQDEGPAKMGASRSSWMYQAHWCARTELLKGAKDYWCWVLSATPMARDPVGYFNVCRLLDPGRAGTVEAFERDHVNTRDEYGNPKTFKNLDRSEEPWVVPLVEKLRGLVVYRSKAEPEIAACFPTKVAMPPGTPGYTFVEPTPIEQDFWNAIYAQYADGSQSTLDVLFGLMRLVVGHPMALTRSEGAMAQDIVRLVGKDGLANLPTTKLDAFVNKLHSLDGAQAVSFTYFGQAILPLIHQRLLDEGFSVVVNHGEVSPKDRKLAQETFNAGDAQIYLSSDAGARGVNLPAGEYAIDYDIALTEETARQRRDRIDRLNSHHRTVYFTSMVVKHTIEMGIANLCADRQQWSQDLGNDDGSGLSAKARKYILQAQRH